MSHQQNLIPPTTPISEQLTPTSQHNPPPLNDVIVKIATPPPVQQEDLSITSPLRCYQKPDGSSLEDLAIKDLPTNNNNSIPSPSASTTANALVLVNKANSGTSIKSRDPDGSVAGLTSIERHVTK